MSKERKELKEIEEIQQALAEDKQKAPPKVESATAKWIRRIICYGLLLMIVVVIIMAFLRRSG